MHTDVIVGFWAEMLSLGWSKLLLADCSQNHLIQFLCNKENQETSWFWGKSVSVTPHAKRQVVVFSILIDCPGSFEHWKMLYFLNIIIFHYIRRLDFLHRGTSFLPASNSFCPCVAHRRTSTTTCRTIRRPSTASPANTRARRTWPSPAPPRSAPSASRWSRRWRWGWIWQHRWHHVDEPVYCFAVSSRLNFTPYHVEFSHSHIFFIINRII